MSSEFNSSLPQTVDSLLDRLAELAVNSKIAADFFLQETVETIEEVLASERVLVLASGPNQSWIWVAGSDGSKDLFAERVAAVEADSPVTNHEARTFVQAAFKEDNFVVSPVEVSGDHWGWLVVELEARTNGKSLLPLIDAVSEILATHIRSRPLLGIHDESSFWDDFFNFSLHAHASLEPQQVASLLADDLRLFIHCERASLFEIRGNSPRLMAISAVTKVESRTRLMRDMKSLVAEAAKTGAVFISDIPQSNAKLSSLLETYAAKNDFSFIAGIPLQAMPLGGKKRQQLVGYLLLESNSQIERLEFSRRLKLVIPHASLSLLNAKRFSAIPFHGLLSRGFGALRVSGMLKIILGIAILALLLTGLTTTTATFKIRMDGELRPPDERLVFSPGDGVVTSVMVNHGEQVGKSQILLEVQSPDLDLEIQQLEAELRKLNTLRESLVISINQEATGNAGDRVIINQLTAEVADLDRQAEAGASKLEFLNKQRSNLRVPSPIDGRVISWEIKRLLTNKPVRWGEALMNVADEEGTWRLVFKAPEHRIGYILDAATDSEEPLTLEYSFDSDPGQKYGATISTIAKSTDFDSQLGPFVIIECLPDSQNFPKRHGAKVYASVKCGERSVLFIWTHELVDSIRRQFVW